MVGQLHTRHLEIIDPDSWAVKDEIQLPFWITTWKGGLRGLVGVLQTGGRLKQLKFFFPQENIEIARYDVGAAGRFDHVVQMEQLILPRLVAESQMDKEEGDVLQLQLNHKLFHTPLEIMVSLGTYRILGQKCIPLLVVNWDVLPTGVLRIFRTVGMEMAHLGRNFLHLALATGAIGSIIHLDQPHHIRIDTSDELNDLVQMVACSSQHSQQGEFALVSMGRIADVVE